MEEKPRWPIPFQKVSIPLTSHKITKLKERINELTFWFGQWRVAVTDVAGSSDNRWQEAGWQLVD